MAQQTANHEFARTTGLYDRRNGGGSLDEVEPILISSIDVIFDCAYQQEIVYSPPSFRGAMVRCRLAILVNSARAGEFLEHIPPTQTTRGPE